MPKIVDHDQRRAAIVAATCDLIASEGLDAATMRRIAERTGSTTGLVTHYFESKQAVLVAALREVHRAAGKRMFAAIASTTRESALRAVVEESLPLDAPRRAEWRIWLAFWGQAATDMELGREQHRRYAEWTGLLDELVSSPDGSRADGSTAVDELIALIDGVGTRATLDPDAFPAERQLALVDRFLVDARA